MYLFKGVENTPRPYSVILRLPVVERLSPFVMRLLRV
jgi:hypothetical protein